MFLEVMGRLDHLVEAVYDRFKDRYFPDESKPLLSSRTFAPSEYFRLTTSSPEVYIDIKGDKYVLNSGVRKPH